MIPRVKTFVRGLDEIMDGGIPEGSVVLVLGKPGTMKSSIAYSIIYKNVEEAGRKGLYVSLEQSASSLIENMAGMGFTPPGVDSNLSVLDLGLLRKKMTQLTQQAWIEIFRMYILNLKGNFNFDLLVIDSVPVLEMLAKFKEPRDELFQLFEWLRDMKVTTFLIHEETSASMSYGEDFLADGIIHLDLRRELNAVNLFLSIMKMRRTNHRRGYFPLIFEHGNFEIVTD
ncbi:MAG: ATPase domain-containing protein [Thermoplasmata archaeon]